MFVMQAFVMLQSDRWRLEWATTGTTTTSGAVSNQIGMHLIRV